MRLRTGAALAGLLTLAGCAQQQPLLVMMNPQTGTTVDCPLPDRMSGSGQFLVSRACLSACSVHGFRPMLGAEVMGLGDTTPEACLN